MRVEYTAAATPIGGRDITIVGRLFNRYSRVSKNSAVATRLAGGGFLPYGTRLRSPRTNSNSSFDTTTVYRNEGMIHGKKSSKRFEETSHECWSGRTDDDLPLPHTSLKPQLFRAQVEADGDGDGEVFENMTRSHIIREIRQPSSYDCMETQSEIPSGTDRPLSHPKQKHPVPIEALKTTNAAKIATVQRRQQQQKLQPQLQQQRKVEFAGTTHLSLKPGQIDTVTIVCCRFLDHVDVRVVPSYSMYATAEHLWYTKEEIQRFKDDCLLRTKRKHQLQQLQRKGYSSNVPSSSPSPAMNPSSLAHTQQPSHRHTHSQQRSLVAILLCEQDRQRQLLRFIYGRRSGDALDPNRLKRIYTQAGTTEQRKEEALVRAKALAASLQYTTETAAVESGGTSQTSIKNNDSQIDTTKRNWDRYRHETTIEDNNDDDSHKDAHAFAPPPTIINTTGTGDNFHHHHHSCIRPARGETTKDQFLPMAGFLDTNLDGTTRCCDKCGLVLFAMFPPLFQPRNNPLFLEVGDEILVA